MIRTIVRILGAACSALLLYFSYDLQFGVMLAIAAIFVLIAAIAQAKMLLQCILQCIFYSIFVCAQWLFIISSVVNGDAISAMMLVPLAVLLIHLIPVCLCIVLFKRNRVGLHSKYMFYAKHITVVDAIYIILLLLLLFFANNWQNEPFHKKV